MKKSWNAYKRDSKRSIGFFDSDEIWIFEIFFEKWKSPDGSFLFLFIFHFLSYKRQPFLLLKRIASFADMMILFLIASLTFAIIVHSSLLLCSCRVVNNHVKALFKEGKIVFFHKYFFHWLNCNNKEMISININIYLHLSPFRFEWKTEGKKNKIFFTVSSSFYFRYKTWIPYKEILIQFSMTFVRVGTFRHLQLSLISLTSLQLGKLWSFRGK